MTLQQSSVPAQTFSAAQQLETWDALTQALARARDLNTLLASYVTASRVPIQRALLLLGEPSEDRLMIKAAVGYDLAALRTLAFVPGDGMIGAVLAQRQSQLYPDPASVRASSAQLTWRQRETLEQSAHDPRRTASALNLPLLLGETQVGVLRLENIDPANPFTRTQQNLLEHFSAALALAIANHQLKRSARHQAIHWANQSMDNETLAVLAHEMRTPLTSIKGYTTALLADEITFSPAKQREFLQFIDNECATLEALIHDILESSLLDAGRLQLEWQPVQLPHLARVIVDEISRLYAQHRIIVDFPENFPMVEGDPQRLAQVLRNLLDNAAKYSAPGGLVVVRGEIAEHEVSISVADQGIGIAPEHLNRLFDKFFRVKSRDTRRAAGTGLGLPIARALVEAHGGRIWAESQPERGSTFYFTLPCPPFAKPDAPTGGAP